MRAIVTGGAGFIGSHLVDALRANGHDVHVLDIKHGESVTIGPSVINAFDEFRPDTVFHLAAQIDVRRSVLDPAFDASTNILGTINVLEQSIRHNVSRFVLSSSGGAIYGDTDWPASEIRRPKPASPYGQSKLAAEGYANLAQSLHGLPTINLRYSNVYGPRQTGGVVSIFAKHRADQTQPVINGDGSQTRDFLHVSDVVKANLLAAESPMSPIGGTLNIASGKATSVNDLAQAFGLTPTHREPNPGEIQDSILDPNLAEVTLGWKAEVDLATGIQDMQQAQLPTPSALP